MNYVYQVKFKLIVPQVVGKPMDPAAVAEKATLPDLMMSDNLTDLLAKVVAMNLQYWQLQSAVESNLKMGRGPFPAGA